MPRIVCAPNLAAFLDMIAFSEGTKGKGDDGYDILVGGQRFITYADHPRRVIEVRPGLKSTAAGRYQLIARYFDAYCKQLGLTDFAPESQDLIALQQIKECRALALIEAGRFSDAVAKCAHIWASFPNSGYGQPERKLSDLLAAYQSAGGTLA